MHVWPNCSFQPDMLYHPHFLAALQTNLKAVLPLWGFSISVVPELMAFSENATFRAREGERDYVLRIYRPHYHTREEILSELLWIDALSADDIVPTARLHKAQDGARLQSFMIDGQLFYVMASDFLSATGLCSDSMLVKDFFQLGQMAARLHLHSLGWQKPAQFTRKIWNIDHLIGPHAYWGDWRKAINLTPQGQAVIEKAVLLLKDRVEQYGMEQNRFGLIHGDMRVANLIKTDGRLALIDFDDCGFSWFGFDFAASVSFIEDDPRIIDYQMAWLEGYRQIRNFSKADEKMLADFIMIRRIQLTAWLTTHAETSTAKELNPYYTDNTVALAETYIKK